MNDLELPTHETFGPQDVHVAALIGRACHITITYYDFDKTDTEAIFVATWPIPDGTDDLNWQAVAASIAKDLAARVREADSK